MKMYRKGWNLIWRRQGGCPHYLRSFGLARKYNERNQHGGCMPAMPHEARLLTDTRVRRIVNRCGHSGKITIDELKAVRRMFSYIWQIQGNGGDRLNFPCMRSCFKDLDRNELAPSWKSNAPMRMPTPGQLRHAFTKPWSETCGVPLLPWSQMLLAAYDTFLNGHRPSADTNRVKAVHDGNGGSHAPLYRHEARTHCHRVPRRAEQAEWAEEG